MRHSPPGKGSKSKDAAGQTRRLPRAAVPRARKKLHADGRPFKPGTNSHDGTVYRRGPDILPRGAVRRLYDWFLNDDGGMAAAIKHDRSGSPRVVLMQSLLKAAEKPGLALHLAEMLADRLEGKPVQSVHVQERRTPIFQGPPGESPSGAPTTPPPGPTDPESLVPVLLPETVEPETEFRRR